MTYGLLMRWLCVCVVQRRRRRRRRQRRRRWWWWWYFIHSLGEMEKTGLGGIVKGNIQHISVHVAPTHSAAQPNFDRHFVCGRVNDCVKWLFAKLCGSGTIHINTLYHTRTHKHKLLYCRIGNWIGEWPIRIGANLIESCPEGKPFKGERETSHWENLLLNYFSFCERLFLSF